MASRIGSRPNPTSLTSYFLPLQVNPIVHAKRGVLGYARVPKHPDAAAVAASASAPALGPAPRKVSTTRGQKVRKGSRLS